MTGRKELAEKVAKKVGEPPFTVVVNEGRVNPSSYLRVAVYVNVMTTSEVRSNYSEGEEKNIPCTMRSYRTFSISVIVWAM